MANKLLLLIIFYNCNIPDKKVNYEKCRIIENISSKDSLILYYPSYSPKNNSVILSEGDTFKILSTLNLDSGEWKVFIDLSLYETVRDSVKLKEFLGFPKGGYYFLKEINIIKEMKKNWIVQFLKTDCCTSDFSIDFLKNDTLKLSLGAVILRGAEGFQTSEYGWTPLLQQGNLTNYYKYFRYYDLLRVIKR